ncbi:MAG: MFS transporter [Deltaproteobacteria bacterium]
MLRALHHRNYRLFFGGQGISLIGTWLTRVATSWLVYRLTNSAAVLGILGFAGQIPAFLLAPFAGVLVDRWDRHRLLVVTQTLSMVQSFALAVLALTRLIEVWQIIALSIFQGFINAFDMPGRQAFVVEMVENREDLANAIALNSSMFNGARLVGPSVAGVLIASVGEGMCFLLDGFSYLAVIGSLLAMHTKRREIISKGGTMLRGLADGFHFAFGFAPVRAVLLLIALTGLMGIPYVVLMPIFASQVLQGNSHTFGFLMAAAGVGALAGALFLASRKSVRGLGRIIPSMAAAFGVGLILFSLSRTLWLSLALLFVVGLGMMVETASSNTILQTIVDDDKRGRVMSFYTTAFLGMTPFGSLLAGQMASRIGAPLTIMVDGIFILMGAVLFARKLPHIRKMVRPIYVRKGIIPEVATGIQAASHLTGQPKE